MKKDDKWVELRSHSDRWAQRAFVDGMLVWYAPIAERQLYPAVVDGGARFIGGGYLVMNLNMAEHSASRDGRRRVVAAYVSHVFPRQPEDERGSIPWEDRIDGWEG